MALDSKPAAGRAAASNKPSAGSGLGRASALFNRPMPATRHTTAWAQPRRPVSQVERLPS